MSQSSAKQNRKLPPGSSRSPIHRDPSLQGKMPQKKVGHLTLGGKVKIEKGEALFMLVWMSCMSIFGFLILSFSKAIAGSPDGIPFMLFCLALGAMNGIRFMREKWSPRSVRFWMETALTSAPLFAALSVSLAHMMEVDRVTVVPVVTAVSSALFSVIFVMRFYRQMHERLKGVVAV